MDSLLATYASSDEDDGDLPRQQSDPNPGPPPPSSSASAASLFNSLPPPESSSSSLFGSIADRKSRDPPNHRIPEPQPEAPVAASDSVFGSGRLFDSLPQPRSRTAQTIQNQTTSRDGGGEDLSSDCVGKRSGFSPSLAAPRFGGSIGEASLNLPAPKKVVRFKPPVISWGRRGVNDDDGDDEEDQEEKERKRRRELQSSAEAPTVKSFLASIPPPKNSRATLGALPSSGSGRRSVIDADVPSLKQQQQQKPVEEATVDVAVDSNDVVEGYQGGYVDASGLMDAGIDSSKWYQSYGADGSCSSYENNGGYCQYDSNWIDRSGSNSLSEAPAVGETMARVMGKSGRSEIPTEIIEVKQDELMKNRPREDQVKATGIAFGPLSAGFFGQG